MSNSIQLIEGSDRKLAELVSNAMAATGRKVQSVTSRSVSLTSATGSLANNDALGEVYRRGKIVLVNGRLEGELEGEVRLLMPIRSAVTLGAYTRMAAKNDVLASRNAGIWTAQDEHSFGEIAAIMFAAIDESLREQSGSSWKLRYSHLELLESGDELTEDKLGESAMICYEIACKIGEFPTEQVFCMIPYEVAERLNEAPLCFVHEDEEDFEPAPIRGDIAAFAMSADVLKVLRVSCRRVGLTLDKRPRSEVPNPAAYHDQIVLIELGRGQEKRFEWCRRLKAVARETKVVLILREPTTLAVTMAFRVHADAVIGWPTRERQLSEKLDSLLPAPADA